ncbi:cytochrome P450 [Brasilonema sp. UFV-L1]|uniref:cytochrome P450 n=1 Tax=Brasilonema sp. UFV-L1 TaxID=2234130 RepID=UPI00145E2980|nr:cytochrome P450 [Brasilonema sp. UFV-L1]NMG10808.1 cytochrome P450 [Brasilonema sp. UFV-L1]
MQLNHQVIDQKRIFQLAGDRHVWYAKMRQESPILYHPEHQAWTVFRYEDVKQILSDWHTFSSKVPHPPEQTDFTQSLNFTDPPKHHSLRTLVAKVFTQRRVELLAPRMLEMTHELLDRVEAQGRMDFIHDFSSPFPVIVIAEILGVPIEEREDFKRWSNGIIAEDLTAYQAMGDYFRQLLQQRQGKPGKDLISDLIAAHEGGDKLTAQELVDFCIVLLVAGHETTTNLLANAIVCFHEYPEAYKQLQNEPSLLPLAIEEVLRYRSPAQIIPRFTKVETQISNQIIPAGQLIRVCLGEANRDEQQFEEADKFVIDRDPNEHVAFGNGIHFCLGAPLARLEAKIGLSTVLERLPNLRIEPNAKLELVASADVHGFKALPVLF